MRGRCGIAYIECREISLLCLLVVNSVEEIDIELCVCVYWLSWRNLSSESGQKSLRNLDIKMWEIAENFEKAGIVFAS